jgi:2-desacetyl-2-hydroxyethyl bacteriochlorophyllide A dehydrogenase
MAAVAAKRLLFPQVGQVMWESFEIPARPEPHTVIAEALCSLISVGTELALYTGTHIGFTLPEPPFPMMPQRPGYALVGRVIAVGEEVEAFQPGQRVLMEAPHGSAAIVDVRQTSILPLPDEVTDAAGTLIRMAGIALTAVRIAPLQLGDPVVVFGMGLVGQLAAQLYLLNGGQPVIGIDRLANRLAIAQANGIQVLNADETDVPAEVARLTDGRGPEVVVEATGSPAVVPLALDLVAKGGRVTLLGSTRGRAEIDVYSHIHRKGVQVIGAHESVQTLDLAPVVRWSKERNLRLLARLFAEGALHAEGLISHTIRPTDLPSIYDTLAENPQDYLGVLVDWKGDYTP